VSSRPALLLAVRYGLPVVLVVAGVAFLAIGGSAATAAGFMFFGCAGVVIVANVLFRMGVSGEADREEEEAARRFFDKHGHWPDEAR
jgi:hypothetical protein